MDSGERSPCQFSGDVLSAVVGLVPIRISSCSNSTRCWVRIDLSCWASNPGPLSERQLFWIIAVNILFLFFFLWLYNGVLHSILYIPNYSSLRRSHLHPLNVLLWFIVNYSRLLICLYIHIVTYSLLCYEFPYQINYSFIYAPNYLSSYLI